MTDHSSAHPKKSTAPRALRLAEGLHFWKGVLTWKITSYSKAPRITSFRTCALKDQHLVAPIHLRSSPHHGRCCSCQKWCEAGVRHYYHCGLQHRCALEEQSEEGNLAFIPTEFTETHHFDARHGTFNGTFPELELTSWFFSRLQKLIKSVSSWKSWNEESLKICPWTHTVQYMYA